MGGFNDVGYNASKHGVVTLTRYLKVNYGMLRPVRRKIEFENVEPFISNVSSIEIGSLQPAALKTPGHKTRSRHMLFVRFIQILDY